MAAGARSPEIIALHIPRTAGTAFNRVLESVYGKEDVEDDRSGQTPDVRALRHDFEAWNHEMQRAVEGRTSWPRVISGHFPLTKYERFRDAAFTMVWLREPAARLLSTYFYVRTRPSAPGPAASSWARAVPPERIMEVDWPENPVSEWFLRGYDLDAFDFVGIQEHFREDVADLGRILGWPPVEIPIHNRTTTREYLDFRPADGLLRRIREINHADVELYEQALERRRLRIAGVARSQL
jgi:hypothetical protein